MKSIAIPLEFLKAIGEKSPAIRIFWIKWLADYSNELLKNDFIDLFVKDMVGKNLNLDTIKEAYEFGIPFFKDGFTFIDESKPKTKKKKYSDEVTDTINKVILYLNEKSNATYTPTKTNCECINARINDGYTISDFKRVIDSKVEQWLNTEQQKYLRPITLFSASKFENYLNEPIKQLKDGKQRPTSAIEKLSNASNKAKQFLNGSY